MTIRRGAAYGGLFCLLAAWLASAASTTFDRQRVADASLAAPSEADPLDVDFQAQAAKLRERLATAPAPQAPHRNPFVFEARAPRHAPAPPVRELAPVDVPAAPAAPPEPALFLVGVAEDQGPQGPTRTAILSDDREGTYMAAVGGMVGGRYEVQAIGADAVELKDLITGGIRRLALR
jgi:hypothetical protein